MTWKAIQNILLTIFSMSLYPLTNKPIILILNIKHGYHTIIDNIFTNILNNEISSWVIIDDTSDHFPIFCCAHFSL